MISLICGVLSSWSYGFPSANLIPPEFCFDKTKATEGCKKARGLVAQSYGVPEQAIQFIVPQLFFNQDNMEIYCNFLSNGNDEGNTDDGKTALVTKQAADHKCYGVHYQKLNCSQFNGLKIRLTNQLAAGGGLAPAWVQVLGFTDEEMPPEKVPTGLIILKVS